MFWLVQESNTHECQVVVGLGTSAMFLYGGLEFVNDLAGGETLGIGHQFQQMVVAELLHLPVLGLVQTVGIDQQLFAADIVDMFAIEWIISPKAERMVLIFHLHEPTVEHRGIVATVAEVEPASVEVEPSDKHRDEHHTFIVLCQSLVHTHGDVGGHHAFRGEGAEEAGALGHEQ